MTRLIITKLDNSVTDTECGECCYRHVAWSGHTCRNDALIESYPRPFIVDGKRTDACLESERRASRMVEIDPSDAKYMDCACGEPSECTPAIERIEEALREHGSKR